MLRSALALSEAKVALLLAPNGASVLASWLRDVLAFSAVIEAIIASQLAPIDALALASRDRRDWALCRAKVVSQSETIIASHEADSRDLASQKAELDFLIQTALAKTILDLRGFYLHAKLILSLLRLF